MEKHDARNILHWKHISLGVLNMLDGQVYIHLAFTEVAFRLLFRLLHTRMNSTTINVDALTE